MYTNMAASHVNEFDVNPTGITIDNGKGNWIGNLKRCYETGNDVFTICYGNYSLISG